ncbi:hypothetical protein MNEG_1312 [Monoraphidium neglectum]|uniref:Peptidase C1A papain C-terminal domain-containing protein n=1 Tax=Monoraphidium neglectum TaxID=145388 RepID=A0A0D2LJV3_9CHLO|nr:hypothetical protein MNEG_1312 [Monoraphidium neglectum]KIZ06644.1 hypothetical protein MNEG_1312 [Monoraphidium neglectum]|eukprot:XP_013905663.1 hypothetical protein MNEG_1312 [Monoraphidium neglectum]
MDASLVGKSLLVCQIRPSSAWTVQDANGVTVNTRTPTATARTSTPIVQGQGVMPGLPGPGLFGEESTLKTASANTYASFIKQWSGAKAWQRALQVAPRAACVGTSKDSLCAPQVEQDAEKLATLMFATSPAAYSALDPREFGYAVVPPPRDEGVCWTVAAFVAVTAAEAAVASALGEDVAQVGQLSPQDLYYCGDAKRDCLTGASLKDTLAELAKRQLLLEKCLPYQQPKDVTRFDIYSDFKIFFANNANIGAVYRPAPGSKFVEGHAITLVGYDNVNQFWIARNSWGPGFAQNGTFKKLLLDNLDTLRDLDSPLAGKKLAVCPQGVSPPA